MTTRTAARAAKSASLGIVGALLLGLSTEITAHSQSGQTVATPSHIQVEASDAAAVSGVASDRRIHILPARTEAGKTTPLDWPPVPAPQRRVRHMSPSQSASTAVPSVPFGFYPADLSYLGGPVVTSAKFHNLYANVNNKCPTGSCSGDPGTFLVNLGASTFLHLTDQYTGLTTNNRYVKDPSIIVSSTIFGNVLGENDILQIVHAGAKAAAGSGYGHIYNVILPQGIDTCFDLSSACYSPDNPASFFFCAYHSSVTFSDIGHVLYTVEPYQAVPGCAVPQSPNPSPNGVLIDSTASALSHEVFETITDPDPGTGWVAQNSGAVLGQEVADLCGGVIFGIFPINTRQYEVQLEYSNFYHACANS